MCLVPESRDSLILSNDMCDMVIIIVIVLSQLITIVQ